MKTVLDAIVEEAEGRPDPKALRIRPSWRRANEEDEGLDREVNRSSRDYVRWAQTALNQVLGTRLAVDGIVGSKTRQAIRLLQERFALDVDGRIGPNTEAMLIHLSFTFPPKDVSSGVPGRRPDDGRSPEPQCELTYSVPPGREYGPRFRSGRPPGLPSSARRCSQSGAAIPHVRESAAKEGAGATFVDTVAGLATTESGGTFARPANIFNALPAASRGGKHLITAWGVFQFNRDAWRALRKRIPGARITAMSFPWEATACEEIDYPVQRYAQLFSEIRRAGGSEIDAARGIRLWHRSPNGAYRPYLRNGLAHGFARAWAQTSSRHRDSVDRQLRRTGVLTPA